jgi:protocatechuate 3,4-dioxygenase beta subunit
MTLTPAQTEGPYYTPNSPQKNSLLEAGMDGTQIIITGYVVNTDCEPIANAWLDFWQADDQGAYDNAGYRLRGHLFTDETGRYALETIVPGEYPGRPPHIHVKVQAPNGSILTSQIYFPGVAANERDSIFDPALLADVQDSAGGKVATFNFVLNAP